VNDDTRPRKLNVKVLIFVMRIKSRGGILEKKKGVEN
jgi:hypothetical protein